MMLNYSEKEAKALRVEIRKKVTDLRGPARALAYPDADVRETLMDIWEWSKREGCLNQALRRAYDLHYYILFNLEDNLKGHTEWSDKSTSPFTLTDAQVDLALEIDEFCVMCANIISAGGMNPGQAWELHDGSNAPVRSGRETQSTRRGDDRFNRNLAIKESIAEFKAAQLEKNREYLASITTPVYVDPVEIAAEYTDLVNGLVEEYNKVIMEDNFTLNPEGRGGIVVVLKTKHGFKVTPKAKQKMPKTRHEVIAVIYIKRPLTYTNRDQYMYGESYIAVTHPVSETYFNRTGQSHAYNKPRKKSKMDLDNENLIKATQNGKR